MSSLRAAASLRKLREQPLWRLFAADTAPAVIAVLQTLLLENERVLPGSVLLERLTRELEELRAIDEDLGQAPQAYLNQWLAQGWLTRHLPPGRSEEVYELTADAIQGIRFITSVLKPRSAATESRLATVIGQLTRLAEETDPDPQSRVAALVAERERIDREIQAVQRGAAKTLHPERSLERAREIIALADELAADFRNVRDEFDKLNRGLRQSLLENEGSRSDVLESVFQGIDVIAESDPGRTFNAFWRLLTDPEQSALLMDALNDISSRPFTRQLDSKERRFLLNLTGRLMQEGGSVHDVLQHFARNLKSFVQSREFLEQRRLHALLLQAQQAALAAKDKVRPNATVGYELMLTTSRVSSASQWQLFDPEVRVVDPSMEDAPAAEISLDMVGELVRQSEIDFRTLRAHIVALLADHSQITIGQLLEAYLAEQGLGSVVGYIALGVKHGEVTSSTEVVEWLGDDAEVRRAHIPVIYFLRECLVELMA